MGGLRREVCTARLRLTMRSLNRSHSAAGKTQLALQLSLTVQLPSSLGGLSGSTCYLTTRRTLPTERLLQIAHSHPLLAGAFPGTSALTHIHTRAAPDAAQLLYALTTALPLLLSHLHETGQPPLRLVVLDTLAEVFHDAARTSTHSLVQRAQTLNRAGAALHALARTHGLAALVLNEVSDVFADYAPSEPGEFVYREHARWFARAEGGPMLPGVERKEAALGLAWANQPNVRVMLSRTDRRRYVDLVEAPAAKRRRVDGVQDGGEGESGLTLVRRLSVIFSSVGPQAALDYVVTEAGVVALPLEEDLPAVDADARSDAYSDFGGVEDEDLLSALAEAEGRSANATDVTPATSDAPDASGMLVAPGLDAQEEIALEQSEALLEEDLVAEADVTVDEEVPTAVDEDGPDDMPSEDHGLG